MANSDASSSNQVWHPELSNHQDFEVGQGCTIHSHTWIGSKVKIGSRVKIQAFVFIPDGVTIEDDVFIGPHVCFTNDKYPPSPRDAWALTMVKRGASIGAGAVIGPGVEIGEGAMVGMGAVVVRSVRPHSVVAGNPARELAEPRD